MRSDHITTECDQDPNGLKCAICGCNHSSLDRRCKVYIKTRRDAANLAVEKITNSRTNANKKQLKDNIFNSNSLNPAPANTSAENKAKSNEIDTIQKEIKDLQTENRHRKTEIDKCTNRSEFEKGLEKVELAIASSNGLASKLDETLKTISQLTSQIAKQECDLVRNEVEASLAQQKREFTENFFNNQTRIAKNWNINSDL